MRPGARSPGGRGGPVPTTCLRNQCYDTLVRACVDCQLLTSRPRLASPARLDPTGAPCPPSLAPGSAACTGSLETALRPQEPAGSGPALRLPALLFGAPAGLGLALALVLLALVTWLRRRRGAAPPATRDPEPDEPPDSVITLPPGVPEASAPAGPPATEDSAASPPTHSVPVPATELGSTKLVTTKTAGPEQQ